MTPTVKLVHSVSALHPTFPAVSLQFVFCLGFCEIRVNAEVMSAFAGNGLPALSVSVEFDRVFTVLTDP